MQLITVTGILSQVDNWSEVHFTVVVLFMLAYDKSTQIMGDVKF